MADPVRPLVRGDRFSFLGDTWRVIGGPDAESIITNRADPNDVVARKEGTKEKWMFSHEFLTDCVEVELL